MFSATFAWLRLPFGRFSWEMPPRWSSSFRNTGTEGAKIACSGLFFAKIV
jgi:hypothetical protein